MVTSEALSKLGSEFSLIAVAFAVLAVSGSPSDLGLALMARTFPPVLLLLIGGVWADRFSRAKLMISADLVALVAQASLGLVLLTGHYNIWLVVLFQAMLGSATAMFRPAIAGLIPQTVPKSDLQSANSLISIVGSTAGLVGPVLAGGLMLLVNPGVLILVDAATFLISAAILSKLWSVTNVRRTDAPRNFVREAGEGISYVLRSRWLSSTIVQSLLFQAGFAVFFTLGPALTLASGGGAQSWGIMVTAFGGGSLLGGLIALHFRPRTPMIAMQFVLILTIPALFAMAFGAPLVLQAIGALLAGAAFALSDTIWDTYLQATTPEDRLGRVASVAGLSGASLRPFGYLLAGFIAVLLGTAVTFVVTATILFASIVVVLLLLLPKAAELRAPEYSVEEVNSEAS
ncbi:MFS transporter [Arthrobacter sp. Y-9]|uniref:MFS transporter n=1 Tax=Arthrobacter sp. Y-9 TaxID=3039385 RepID=UPI00241D4BFD|nr:MFS transporter [Arthrobacter sp. Y-9]WFR83674.1 MFS transporter [Arthrobacter sp. Y-9]